MIETGLHIPTLRTERFLLRAPRLSDMDAYAAFCASDRARAVGGPYSRDRAFLGLAALIGHWSLRGYGRWMVAARETDAPLGVVGLMNPPDWPEPEIAWSVFGEAEGKGVAYEAALATRRFAYDTLGFTTLISCTAEDNTRSQALARRMGAVREGVHEHPDHGPLIVWRHPSPEALA